MLVSVHALYGAYKGESAFVNMIKVQNRGMMKREANEKYEAERDQLLHIISSYSVLAEEQAMQNEVKELLYYVQQRYSYAITMCLLNLLIRRHFERWKCKSAVTTVRYGISSIHSA